MQQMLRSFIVAMWPDGGQGAARRNAWSAMVEDTQRARERASAEAAVVESAKAARAATLVAVSH